MAQCRVAVALSFLSAVSGASLRVPRALAEQRLVSPSVRASKDDSSNAGSLGDSCAYDFPVVDTQEADQWNVTGAILRAYGENKEAGLTGLKDEDVTDSASRWGPRSPFRKCPHDKITADGECEVATCTEDTYGEITQEGAVKMFADPSVALKAGDTFFDLGSGLGKLVLDAAVFVGAQGTGVELSSLRFGAGCDSLARLADEMQEKAKSTNGSQALPTRRLELRNNDMLKTDLRAADVVYVASLCFRPALMVELYHHLAQSLEPGARVVSLRRFPEVPAAAGDRVRLAFSTKLRVMMTWNDPKDPNPVFVYDASEL